MAFTIEAMRPASAVRRLMPVGIICGGLIGPLPASGQASPALPGASDTALARGVFAEARAICDRDGGRLWGRSLCRPLLLVQPESRAAMANEPDSAGVLKGAGGMYLGVLPQSVGVANTAVEWGGRRWTMLMWPLPDERYDRQRLLAHEMFHGLQPELGFALGNPLNAHLDSRDARTWLRLEWRALAEALIREAAERRQAIADALAFRARRRSLYPDAAVQENALELNEGIAEYTGFKLSGLPESVLPDRAAVQLRQYDGRESFSRSFAYASGPAYGLLLDPATRGQWRRTLASSADLGQLLARAYGVQPTADTLVDARAARYDGPRVVAEETRRAAQREAVLARFKAQFVDGPVLRLPVDEHFGYTFDPTNTVSMPGTGTVYSGAEIQGGWGVLKVESGGVLLTRNGSNLITGVIVPAPRGAANPTAGEGWSLKLTPGWSVVPGDRAGDWTVKRS